MGFPAVNSELGRKILKKHSLRLFSKHVKYVFFKENENLYNLL